MTDLLSQIKPEEIDQILMADPETLELQDLDKLLEFFRAQRLVWTKEETAAKSEGRRPSAKKPKTEASIAVANLSLEDLLKP